MNDLRTAAQKALGFVTSEVWGTTPYMDVRVYEDAAKLRDALRAALAQEQDYWAQEKLRIMEQEHRNSLLRMQQEQAEQTWVCPEAPEERTYLKPGHCENCGKTLVLAQEQAEPVQEPVGHEALRLAGLALIGLAEHDQHCEVFDVDDEGRHKACTCGLVAAIAVITQAGKTTPPKAEPLTEEEIDRIRADEREACAKVCEDTDIVEFEHCMVLHQDASKTLRNAADAIRARGQA